MSTPEVTADTLTDEQIRLADADGIVTQPIARIAARPVPSIARETAPQMVADAINARAKAGAR